MARFKVLLILLLWLLPATTHAQRMEIFLDICNTYEGVDKFEILKTGVSAFIRENPDLDVSITLFGFPPGGEREERFVRLFKGLGVEVRRTGSIYDTLLGLDPDDGIYVVLSGGKGDWDSFKERLREVEAKRLYVIGVALPHPDVMYRLLGVASVSGGRYYNARDGRRLKEVLYEIEKKANYNLEIRVFKSRYEELTDYLMWHYQYLWITEVYPAGRYDRPIAQTYIFPARFNLPTGIYDIKVRYGDKVKWLRGVEVRRRQLARRRVNFAEGLVLVKILNDGHEVIGVERRSRYAWWAEVYEAGRYDRPVEITRTFPIEFSLVNGVYDIKIHYRGYERWIRGVEVKEGKVTNLEVIFPDVDVTTYSNR